MKSFAVVEIEQNDLLNFLREKGYSPPDKGLRIIYESGTAEYDIDFPIKIIWATQA